MRFDMSQVSDADKLVGARLVLSNKIPRREIEVRPVLTQWSSRCERFKQRQLRGVWLANDLERPGYEVARELFLVGDPNWDWASIACRKWDSAGGDFGDAVTTIRPDAAEKSADITASARAGDSVLARGSTDSP